MNPLRFAILAVPVLCGCGGDEASDGDGDADSDSDTATDTTPEVCSDVGQTRTDECGCSQICGDDHTWQVDGPCDAECAPGAVERELCGTCGQTERTCDADCRWPLWSDCAESPFDECVRGEARDISRDGCDPGQVRAEVCSVECLWEDRDCSTDCPGTPRGVGTDAEEICIPGGPFIMGGADETDTDDDPEHEVVLSPYFIGRYEVSQQRAVACAEDGDCTSVDPPDPDQALWPQGMNWHTASAFCSWAGGRLATEAEWEKAARGASPDRRRYPWGDEDPTCEQVSSGECPTPNVDANPGGASPFGVERLTDGVVEWVSDLYDPTYYASSPAADPAGPAGESTTRVIRGPDLDPRPDNPPLTTRDELDVDSRATLDLNDLIGTRCVRGATLE